MDQFLSCLVEEDALEYSSLLFYLLIIIPIIIILIIPLLLYLHEQKKDSLSLFGIWWFDGKMNIIKQLKTRILFTLHFTQIVTIYWFPIDFQVNNSYITEGRKINKQTGEGP